MVLETAFKRMTSNAYVDSFMVADLVGKSWQG